MLERVSDDGKAAPRVSRLSRADAGARGSSSFVEVSIGARDAGKSIRMLDRWRSNEPERLPSKIGELLLDGTFDGGDRARSVVYRLSCMKLR